VGLPVLAVPTTTPRFPVHSKASLYFAEWRTRPLNLSFPIFELKFVHGLEKHLLDWDTLAFWAPVRLHRPPER